MPTKLVEIAKRQRGWELKAFFKKFTKEYPDLWKKMCGLFEKYEEEGRPVIFTECVVEKSSEWIRYDPNEVCPNNLWPIFIFSNGKMDECELFGSDFQVFSEYLENFQPEIATYLKGSILNSFNSLILACLNNH